MHLNKWGKEQLSKQIASLINNLVNWRPEKVPVLALNWKTCSAHTQNMEYLPTELRPESAQDSSCQIARTSNEDTVCRTSNRQRRIPITRNNDFFMESVTANSIKNPISIQSEFKPNDSRFNPNSPHFVTSQGSISANKVIYKNLDSPHSKSLYKHHSSNKFTLLHQNIRGISKKIDEFINAVSSNAPQFMSN
jgi:hypothetical protein